MTIEHLLRRLARLAGARGEPHYGVASTIDRNFPREARLALFEILHNIDERIPWHPSLAEAMKEYLERTD